MSELGRKKNHGRFKAGGKKRKKVIVSDAAPLIQLSLAHSLDLLPRLYEIFVPEEVFGETQHYPELVDAIEIAKAVGRWLTVKTVKDKREVNRLLDKRLGYGEAESIVLYREIDADFLLTSDRYAASTATGIGVKVLTIGDTIREAYAANVIGTGEALDLLETLVGQDILNTTYIRELLEEAKQWP